MKHSRVWQAFALLCCASVLAYAPRAGGESGEAVTVVHSLSLERAVETVIAPAFERKTGAKVIARAIPASEEVSLDPDVGADVLLVTEPELYFKRARGEQLSGYVIFAADAMVVAYRRDGRYAQAVAKGTPWIEAIRSPGVVFARPPQDRLLGQRAIFVLKLAERYYDARDLVKIPAQLIPSEGIVAGLGNGTVDVALLYRSLAVEHGLPLEDLPIEINLADPGRAGLYGEVSTEVGGTQRHGGPILVGAAALGSAKQPELARRFVDFLTASEAQNLLEANGYVIPPGLPSWRQRARGPAAAPPLK